MVKLLRSIIRERKTIEEMASCFKFGCVQRSTSRQLFGNEPLRQHMCNPYLSEMSKSDISGAEFFSRIGALLKDC